LLKLRVGVVGIDRNRRDRLNLAGGAAACSGRAAADRGATTLILSILAKPSVRRPVTSVAIMVPRGSLLASTIGITATLGGACLKMRSSLNTGAATASPMIAQIPTPAATAACPRKPKNRGGLACPVVVLAGVPGATSAA
jgi:hypothetical protein